MENAIAELKAGDKIEFQSVADDTDVKIPEGVEVSNSTGKDITVNDDVVGAGETVTVQAGTTDPSNPDQDPSDPSQQGNADGSNGDKGAPQTGDDFSAVPLIALMGLAAAAAVGTVVYGRRRKAIRTDRYRLSSGR